MTQNLCLFQSTKFNLIVRFVLFVFIFSQLSTSADAAEISEHAEKKLRLLHYNVVCNKYIRDKMGRQQLQRLSSCALVDGGLLLKAATLKEDHNLLMHIDKDCVAIEVRYHHLCYRADWISD